MVKRAEMLCVTVIRVHSKFSLEYSCLYPRLIDPLKPLSKLLSFFPSLHIVTSGVKADFRNKIGKCIVSSAIIACVKHVRSGEQHAGILLKALNS